LVFWIQLSYGSRLWFLYSLKKVDLAAYIGITVSLYGYLSLNFMNFGSVSVIGNLDATFGWIYLHTFNMLVPYQSWDFGLFAGTFLGVFLFCFMVLNRNLKPLGFLRVTVGMTSAIVLFTEIGICLSQPWFLNVYVISAQAGTAMNWFTNLDLTIVASFCFALTSVPVKHLERINGTLLSL